MPIYEYRCLNCNRQVEVFQRVSEPALKICPACGGAYRKVISPVGIIFKGSGFHVNDYGRKSGSGGRGGTSSEERPKTEGSGEAKKSDPAKSGPAKGSSAKNADQKEGGSSKPAADTA